MWPAVLMETRPDRPDTSGTMPMQASTPARALECQHRSGPSAGRVAKHGPWELWNKLRRRRVKKKRARLGYRASAAHADHRICAAQESRSPAREKYIAAGVCALFVVLAVARDLEGGVAVWSWGRSGCVAENVLLPCWKPGSLMAPGGAGRRAWRCDHWRHAGTGTAVRPATA